MSAWGGLWRKEFRQMRSLFWGFPVIEILLFGGFYVVLHRNGQYSGDSFLSTILMIAVLHLIYMSLYLLFSLNQESKRMSLWLYNPRSGWQLLLAKVLNGLLSMIVSVLVCVIAITIVLEISLPGVRMSLIMMFLGDLMAGSVYLSIWVLFLWTVYQVLVPRIGRLAVLANIAILVIVFAGIGFLVDTSLYAHLTEWGRIGSLPDSFEANVGSEHAKIQFNLGAMPAYLGTYVFQAIVAILLFLFSAWLIDKKAEV